jgi:hypothetical protein
MLLVEPMHHLRTVDYQQSIGRLVRQSYPWGAPFIAELRFTAEL